MWIRGITFVLCAIWFVFCMFPLYWGVVTSFKSYTDVSPRATYIPWVDFQPTTAAWEALLSGAVGDTYGPLLNSALIGVMATAIAVLFGAMAAYALVRFVYRIKLLAGLIFALVGLGGYNALRAVDMGIASALGLAFVAALGISLSLNALRTQRSVALLLFLSFSVIGWLIFLPGTAGDPETVLGAPVLFGMSGLTVVTILVVLAISLALARFFSARMWPGKILGNEDVVFWFVSQRMFPPIVSAFALYVLYREVGQDTGVGLLDTYVGMVLVYVAISIPIVVWLMRDFFAAVPVEVEEAALVDNVPRWRIFFQITLPMVMPGLVATALITLSFIWNEFLFALILTTQKWQTLPVLVAGQNSVRGTEWWAIAAAGMFAIIPMIVIAIVLARMMRSGVQLGAIK